MPDITIPPQVGERLYSFDQFEAMPVGSVVAPVSNRHNRYTKQDDGQWQFNGSIATAEDHFSLDGYNMVVSYPDGFTPPAPPAPTLRQFQWNLREHTLRAAEHHGVSTTTVTRALTEMGAEPFDLGPGIKVKSHTTRDALPDGSVLLFGDPSAVRSFGMWAKVAGQWRHVLGDMRAMPPNITGTVHAIADNDTPLEWTVQSGTAESEREIRSFKARAWRVSSKVRDQHSWCSTFEAIMNGVGVDSGCLAYEVTVNGMSVGDRINPAQAATLPVGSILRWRHTGYPTTRVRWFERVEGADNQAGTRMIFGYSDATTSTVRRNNYADVMEIVYVPVTDNPMSLNVDLVHSRDHVPVGTVIQIGRDTNRYMICQDRRLESVRTGATNIPARGSYSWDQMGDPSVLRVTRFGPVS